MPTDHTDRPRWARTGVLRAARFRPSNDGREPLGRDTGPNASVRHRVPTQQPVPFEHRPRHISSSFRNWIEPATNPTKRKRGRTDALRARRPLRSDATTYARVRSWGISHRRQAIPNRLSFCREDAQPPFKLSSPLSASLRGRLGGWLCVLFWDLPGGLRVFVPSCLRRGMGWRIWVHLCDLWALLASGSSIQLRDPVSCRRRSVRPANPQLEAPHEQSPGSPRAEAPLAALRHHPSDPPPIEARRKDHRGHQKLGRRWRLRSPSGRGRQHSDQGPGHARPRRRPDHHSPGPRRHGL